MELCHRSPIAPVGLQKRDQIQQHEPVGSLVRRPRPRPIANRHAAVVLDRPDDNPRYACQASQHRVSYVHCSTCFAQFRQVNLPGG